MRTSYLVLLIAGVLLNLPFNASAVGGNGTPPLDWTFNSGSIQMWYGNELWWEKYTGKQSIEYNASITYETQYRICSNSKLFVAVSILQLVEAGKINTIYDPINDYLTAKDLAAWGINSTGRFCPTLLNSSTCQNISFVSLMSMSSGMIAALSCPYRASDWQSKYCLPVSFASSYGGSTATTISAFIQFPLQSVPGPRYGAGIASNFLYVDENFIVLSYMIEKLSGMSLSAYVQRYVLDVVGLADTFYTPYSQDFAIKPRMTSEYAFFTDVPQSRIPFAVGSCDAFEANPGAQAGSGGFVSTLPDMVKWYSSLFLTRNTTVLRNESIEMILHPWSQEPYGPGFPPQYYGLGVEMFFKTPPMTLPPLFTADAPMGIFYLGSSFCQFFAIILWKGSHDLSGNRLQSTPFVSVAARNNRIFNVTQDVWQAARLSSVGTFFSLTEFPFGWGGADELLADVIRVAFSTGFYFAAQTFPGPVGPPLPTPSVPQAACASSSGISTSSAVLATLIPCLAVIACLLFYIHRSASARMNEASSLNAQLIH